MGPYLELVMVPVLLESYSNGPTKLVETWIYP